MDGTLASEAAARAAASRRRLTIDEPALLQIIRGHFDLDPITQHGADAETPHPAGGISDHFMVVVEQDAEAPVWQNLFDQPVESQQVFLGHAQMA